MDQIIVSKTNEALVLPSTEALVNMFPEAKRLEDGRLVIKHGLAEYVLLRRLGYRLPNPMACYYKHPIGTPFAVQKVTCSLLTANPRAYVLNDMGTGKTKAALWAFDWLYSKGHCGKLIVAAPLSTLDRVWASEVFATLPHRKAVVLHGPKKRRLERLADPDAEIFIINHDGLKVLQDELDKRKDIDVLVIDELAKYRNNNDRSRAMAKYAAKMAFVWGMTGSPMPHEPTDVWMQCRIVTPHTVSKYKTHARDMLMTRKSEFLWVPKPNSTDVAFSWMQPAVRFSLDDVVELPDLVERSIDVPLGPKQKLVYDTIARECHMMVGNSTITALNAAAAMNKLLQISGGYVYNTKQGTLELDADDRKEMLRTLVMSATGKVLVFAPFRHMVEGLSKYFTGYGEEDPNYIDHAYVHGDVGYAERKNIFTLFQDTPKLKCIVAHPGCMAHGLTLTAADTIIWYCPLADLEIYEQANARIRRIGQKHRQQILHLQATPVEKRIYMLLRAKSRVQEKLLTMFENATTMAQTGLTHAL